MSEREDSVENPYRIGDPVMDAAQGRAMIVLDAPDQTVASWSAENNYELTENYANTKFAASNEEAVVECVYVSDVRSEPSKTYTFPASRVRLIDAHHADDGDRIAERVGRDVLDKLFQAAMDLDGAPDVDELYSLASVAGVADTGTIDEAVELAKAARVGTEVSNDE